MCGICPIRSHFYIGSNGTNVVHEAVVSADFRSNVADKRRDSQQIRTAVTVAHETVHALRKSIHLRVPLLEPRTGDHNPQDIDN